jgi:hypothetical protein
MAHYKRCRAKSRRAGCLWCKPHKGRGSNGFQAQLPQEKRARIAELELTRPHK